MCDAVSLALLNELKVQDLARQRTAARHPTGDAESVPSPTAAGFAVLSALPRLVTQAVSLLLAVRVRIVIAR